MVFLDHTFTTFPFQLFLSTSIRPDNSILLWFWYLKKTYWINTKAWNGSERLSLVADALNNLVLFIFLRKSQLHSQRTGETGWWNVNIVVNDFCTFVSHHKVTTEQTNRVQKIRAQKKIRLPAKEHLIS